MAGITNTCAGVMSLERVAEAGESGVTELGELGSVAQLPPDLLGNMTPKQGMGAAFWLKQA